MSFDCEVRPHDRPLVCRQRLPDADQSSVRLSCNPGLPEIRNRGPKERACMRW
jgi:hypothetical protein